MRASKRILIYGVCGSGKSTLAARLTTILDLPYHSVDDIAWLPGWTSRPDAEQATIFYDICQNENWILDTAYGKWIDVVLTRADLIIALDYPRWTSFQRLLRRTIHRILDQRRICNGNVESLRTAFSRESILLWHFKSFKRKQALIRKWEIQKPVPHILIFRSSKQLDRWVESLRFDSRV